MSEKRISHKLECGIECSECRDTQCVGRMEKYTPDESRPRTLLQGLIDTLDQEIKDTLQSGQAAGGAYYAGRHSGLLWARHHIALIESDHQSSQVRALVGAARRLSAEAIAAGHPMQDGEPQPEFIVDPQTLAELDDALSALEMRDE